MGLIASVGIGLETDVHFFHKVQKYCSLLPQPAVLVQRLSVAGVTVSLAPQSILAPDTFPGSNQDLQPVFPIQQPLAVHTRHVVGLNSTIRGSSVQELVETLPTEEDGLGVARGAHRELARAVAELLHQDRAVVGCLVLLRVMAVGGDEEGEGKDESKHRCSKIKDFPAWCQVTSS